jgi:glycosyltransferase involved in cell wall biosynthesis
MKIFFAIKALDNVIGGAERVLADVSSGLARRGHDVTILTYDAPGGNSYYPLPPAIKRIALGIGYSTRPSTLRETLKRMFMLRRVILRQKPDIVVGFMHSMYVPLGLALTGTGVPLIASEHTVPEYYRNRPLEAFLLQIAPYIAKCITVVSEQVKDSYSTALQKHMVSISNPVSVSAQRQADVTGTSRRRKTLLSVGSLTAAKDHKTLVHAFAMVADALPDWDLRIVGDGELKAELQREIAALRLEDRVQLPGPNPAIHEEYIDAQLFAIPSLYESFGLATAEALACGLPAVGFSDCPGVNSLIKNDVNGILVSGNNRTQALADGLASVMGDAEKRQRYGDNARNSMDVYDPDVIVEKWEKLLSKYQLQDSVQR